MSVYFITARELGRVKIGFTGGDPRARKAALQTGCPSQLRIEAVIDGDEIVEAALHRRFAEHRIVGEWFLLTDEIEQIIAGAPVDWRAWDVTSEEVSAAQMQQFVERIEALDERLVLLGRELANTYAEAKASGFDVPLVKHVLKIRKMDPSERAKLDRFGLSPVESAVVRAA